MKITSCIGDGFEDTAEEGREQSGTVDTSKRERSRAAFGFYTNSRWQVVRCVEASCFQSDWRIFRTVLSPSYGHALPRDPDYGPYEFQPHGTARAANPNHKVRRPIYFAQPDSMLSRDDGVIYATRMHKRSIACLSGSGSEILPS